MAAVVLVAGLVLSAFGLYALSRPPTTVTKPYTVTSTYTRTYYSNQNSTYYMVCVATTPIGHVLVDVQISSNATTTVIKTLHTHFYPTETDSRTFFSTASSSAAPGYVTSVSGETNTVCTYVSTAP
jgi:hypothetical protein